jgi:hypothetical protein
MEPDRVGETNHPGTTPEGSTTRDHHRLPPHRPHDDVKAELLCRERVVDWIFQMPLAPPAKAAP